MHYTPIVHVPHIQGVKPRKPICYDYPALDSHLLQDDVSFLLAEGGLPCEDRLLPSELMASLALSTDSLLLAVDEESLETAGLGVEGRGGEGRGGEGRGGEGRGGEGERGREREGEGYRYFIAECGIKAYM